MEPIEDDTGYNYEYPNREKLALQMVTSTLMILAGQQILMWQQEMVMNTKGIVTLIGHEFSLLLS